MSDSVEFNRFDMPRKSPNAGGSAYPVRMVVYALIAIPVFGLLVAVLYDTHRQYRRNVEHAYDTARTIRVMSSAETVRFLNRTKYTLSKLSERLKVRSLNPADCDSELAVIKKYGAGYANVFTLNAKGLLVCSSNEITPAQAKGPDPQYYFSDISRSRQFTIGKPAQGFGTGRWVSTLAFPLDDAHGSFIGVVAASVDLVNYRPLIAKEDFPSGTVTGIVDSDGVLLASSEPSKQKQVGSKVDSQAMRVMLNERQGRVRSTDYLGVPRLYDFAPIAGSNWLMYVSMEEATVLDPVISATLERLGFIVAAVVFVLLMTAKAARNIAQPIEEISKSIGQVGSGDLSARAPIKGPAELRNIAFQLNTMLDVLISANEKSRKNEALFRTAFYTSPDSLSIARLDDGLFFEVNDGLPALTGWTREEIVGKTSKDINLWQNPKDREKLLQAVHKDGHCQNMELSLQSKDGRTWAALISAQQLQIDGEAYIFSVTRDISDFKSAQKKIESLSHFDELTGLPNRVFLLNLLKQTKEFNAQTNRIGALVVADLDGFKTINEAFGHDQGDLVLQEVTSRITGCIGQLGTVARIGSNSFALLFDSLGKGPKEVALQVEATCGRVLAALRLPFLLAGTVQHRTASIGIALFGQQVEDATETLMRAELAMYQAKAAGRDTLRFFDPQMQESVQTRVHLEGRLRSAIRNNHFVLYYQPQVTEIALITGAEALVRWQDPERGMISPAQFIPVAEETGLIIPLGNWILETACHQLALWAKRPHTEPLTLSVNVCALQFQQTDFVEQVLATLKRSGANPHRLKLEITESMLASNLENVIAKMNALKGIGVGFSMDDFGTGFSSLSYLKRLPLDQLKIDQGFVRDILVDANDEAIAKMVIALADSMGLSVMAEGVETQAQLELLTRLGCPSYQGYFFSRPVPIEDFEALICHA